MNSKDISIENMSFADWPMVKEIFLEGVTTGNATFEDDSPEWEEWDSSHIKECRYVARNGNKILGWAALTPLSDRCIYAGVAEISVYVAKESQGIGIGKKLLSSLINGSEQIGIWTLQAGVFAENIASIVIHKKLGFREIGYREKLGKMSYGPFKGKWRDVVLFERRSRITGVD